MALVDYSLQIGTLVMGAGTNYIIHSIDGFGAPIDRTSDLQRPQWHGETSGSDYLDGRTISISATIRGSSPSDAVANLDALLAIWQPITSSGTTKTLSFKFPGQTERSFRGRPRRAAADISRIIGSNIPITLEYRATDPLQYAAAATGGSCGLFAASSGRTYPRTYALAYGGGSSSSLVANNAGTFSTRPTFRISGPATNPSVENLVSGESLSFSIVLGASDYLDVDCDARTVLLNGTASRYSTLSSGSAFFDLDPGNTEIRFRAAIYEATASLSISFSSAWL